MTTKRWRVLLSRELSVGTKQKKKTGSEMMASGYDGGYYAIKGFLYQFDRTLIEVIRNPDIEVAFENRQDIDYDDYVLQIKHKESQKFSPSKIRKAVEQLISMFKTNPALKFVLYCHFKDRAAQAWSPSIDEIDTILGQKIVSLYNIEIRTAFLSSFKVRFSEDYESQFKKLIRLMKSCFSLKTQDEAVLYHSVFRSKLLEKSILPQPQRRVSLSDLCSYFNATEITVFYGAYEKHLGADKYTELIRKTYFSIRLVNLENFERLFTIECDEKSSYVDLIEIVSRISRKYFRRGKSPQPYVCLTNLSKQKLINVKQGLLDQGIVFFDGTHFDGDRFRLHELIENKTNNKSLVLKLLPFEKINELNRVLNFKEVYQFYIDTPFNIDGDARKVRIQVQPASQILKIIR